jgi:hypothetical protein
MTLNITLLNYLTNLSEAGVGLMQLAIWILIAMLGITYALDDEGKNKNFVKPMIWALVVFSGLTYATKVLSGKWSGKSMETMMKESDDKVESGN